MVSKRRENLYLFSALSIISGEVPRIRTWEQEVKEGRATNQGYTFSQMTGNRFFFQDCFLINKK